MAITPIQNLPKIPAPWTIPMRKTEPVDGAVSGAKAARAMLSDQVGVPMIEASTASAPGASPTGGQGSARNVGPDRSDRAGRTSRGSDAGSETTGRAAASDAAASGAAAPAPSGRSNRLPPEGIQM